MTIGTARMKGLRLKVLRNQESAHLPFHCQLSIVNCQLLKAIETAKLRREEINSLHIPYELFYDRPRPVSQKRSKKGG
jgi:hypothetical protein